MIHYPKMGQRRFGTMVQANRRPLRVRREMTIGPADKWLAVHVSFPPGENPDPDAVALRVGEGQVPARKVPIRQSWQGQPSPLLFPLDGYQGKTVTLEKKGAPVLGVPQPGPIAKSEVQRREPT